MAEPPSTGAVDITVNGEFRQVPAGSTVADLLVAQGLGGARVAVERNRRVVPRAEHASAVLEPGDRLEIVAFVGGG